jgi:hypothetical protein
MPVRFTTPSLGGQNRSDVGRHQWQVAVAYRRLTADEWYVGTKVDEARAPFGQPLYLDISSLDVAVSYGLTSRLGLTLTLPFSHGTHSRWYADSKRHKVSAGGLGDVTLIGTYWLGDPAVHDVSNVAIGLGVKTPSGNNGAEDDFFTTTGTTRYKVDQAIQLGDGGWGILLQSQAFRRLTGDVIGYASGSYLLSPRVKTTVQFPNARGLGSGIHLSVPDVYSARAGVSYTISAARGVSLALGSRIDGIPRRDLIGGGDDGFRRPGYTLYADPGVAIGIGRGSFTLNVPLKLTADFKSDLTAAHPKGGDLAEYLVFAGYVYRF